MTVPGSGAALEDGAQEVLAQIRRVVAQFLDLPGEQIHDDRDLRAHGADSIDRVEIIVTLRRQFGVTAPLSSFVGIPHLRALAGYLHAQQGAGQ